ncbi:MAG: O-antigen ligase family protein [Bryobacteraceae bacterium]
MLEGLLLFGIVTLWVPGHWAVSAFQIGVLLLGAWRVVRRMRSGQGIGEHPVSYLLGAILLLGALQWALHSTVDVALTEEALLNWLTNLTVFAVALDLLRNASSRDRFLNVIVWFALALSVVAVFTVLTSPLGKAFWIFETGSGVPTLGPFVYKNQYAAFIEAILPLAVLRALGGRDAAPSGGAWLQNTLVVAVLFGSVVAAASRMGTILCVSEIVLIPLIARMRGLIANRTALGAIFGSLTAMALLALIVGWQPIWQRLQEPNPYSLRLDLVKSSVAMIQERPWTGFGLGTWSSAYPAFARFDDGTFVNQAHNDWLQWGVEGGLPAFLLMLAIAVLAVRPAFRTIWGLGVLAVFVHCMIDYPMQQRPALATFFFAMLGAVIAAGARVPWVKSGGLKESELG